MERAKETAEIINKKVGASMKLDKRIREVDYGDLEGQFVESFTEEMWDEFNKNPEKSNGEPRINVYNRVKSFFDELEKEEGNTLVVTHGGALRMMLYYANNKDKFNMNDYIDCIKEVKIHNTEVLKWEE